MRVIPLFIFISGLAFAVFIIHDIAASPSIQDIRKQREAIAAWPHVTGTLDEVGFQKKWRGGKGVDWYEVDVSYRYSIEGNEYHGSRIGIDPLRETSMDALKAIMIAEFVSPKNIAKKISGVKASSLTEVDTDRGLPRETWNLRSQPVKVYYDSAKPENSLLDPRDHNPPSLAGTMAMYFAFMAISLVMIMIPLLNWRTSISGGEGRADGP